MEAIKIRYRVTLFSPYSSRKFKVEKCIVSPSDREFGRHYTAVEVVSAPGGLERDQAYAYCKRLNEEEEAKERAENPPE